MELTKSQRILITKARNPGGSTLGVYLDNTVCTYITATIILDLGLSHLFPELPSSISPFFGSQKLEELRVDQLDFMQLLGRLFSIQEDADIYFYCLATFVSLETKHMKSRFESL